MAAHGESFDGVERRGLMFVLSSPSGAGKTTLSRLLIERVRGLTLSVSATTRPRRPSEGDGRDYRFVDNKVFEQMVQRGELLEWARVFDNRYGTPRVPVEESVGGLAELITEGKIGHIGLSEVPADTLRRYEPALFVCSLSAGNCVGYGTQFYTDTTDSEGRAKANARKILGV